MHQPVKMLQFTLIILGLRTFGTFAETSQSITVPLFTSISFSYSPTSNTESISVPSFTPTSFSYEPLETTTSSPAASQSNKPGDVKANFWLAGWEGCTDQQKSAINKGYDDMIRLFMPTGGSTYPLINWRRAAALEFWGPAERSKAHRKSITDNLNRAAAVTNQWWITPWAPTLHVRCDDPMNQCGLVDPADEQDDPCNPKKPGESNEPLSETYAYTRAHEAHVNFCSRFFALPDLDHALLSPQRGQWEYVEAFNSKATIWAHELMHISQIGHTANNPTKGIIDQPVADYPGVPYDPGSLNNVEAYGAVFTKYLAQDYIIETNAVDNADNYALFVTANYVQAKLGYYPHKDILAWPHQLKKQKKKYGKRQATSDAPAFC